MKEFSYFNFHIMKLVLYKKWLRLDEFCQNYIITEMDELSAESAGKFLKELATLKIPVKVR